MIEGIEGFNSRYKELLDRKTELLTGFKPRKVRKKTETTGKQTQVTTGESLKTCRTCSQQLPVTKFYKASGMSDGLCSDCKNCIRIARRKRTELARRPNDQIKEF